MRIFRPRPLTYQNNKSARGHLDNKVGHNNCTNNRPVKGIVNTDSDLGNLPNREGMSTEVVAGMWLD